ncbi:MAG: hypothetical protein K2Q20_11475 [Phycisphaerales bacterium]|nr:hypothetical protein [Phycisphaerales bacterium]
MNALAIRLAALASLALASASAHATFFSFASDSNSQGFTFNGTLGAGTSFNLINDSINTFTLRIDDDNRALPSIEIPVNFVSNLVATPAASIPDPVFANRFTHVYGVTGSFSFFQQGTGNLLVRVDIAGNTPSVLTVPGSRNAWSSAGAVIGSDAFTSVTYTATSTLAALLGGASTAAQYGVIIPSGQSQASSTATDDFSFDLTVINNGTLGSDVALDSNGRPTTSFFSEGSYSGFANIPAPGAATLLGLGTLLAARRRRL